MPLKHFNSDSKRSETKSSKKDAIVDQEQTLVYERLSDKVAPTVPSKPPTPPQPPPVTIVYDTLRIDDTVPLNDFQLQQMNDVVSTRPRVNFFKYGKLNMESKSIRNTCDATTNTDDVIFANHVGKLDGSTQTDVTREDATEAFDYAHFEYKLVSEIYMQFERDTLDTLLEKYLDLVFGKKRKGKQSKDEAVPKNPAVDSSGVLVIFDSLDEASHEEDKLEANNSQSVLNSTGNSCVK